VHGDAGFRTRVSRLRRQAEAGLRGQLRWLFVYLQQATGLRSSPRKRGPRATVRGPWIPACAGMSGRSGTASPSLTVAAELTRDPRGNPNLAVLRRATS